MEGSVKFQEKNAYPYEHKKFYVVLNIFFFGKLKKAYT